MKLRFPDYYKKFRCIAERCTDNCCIGWEIDIDEITAERYDGAEGEFGKRLKDNINVSDGVKSFALKGERCAFLNDCNLCDIIINMGEESLCHICREHPRYYEWYGNIKEGGIGLCCEEAARLILTEGTHLYFETDVTDDLGDELDKELFCSLQEVRGGLFSFIIREDVSFEDKLNSLIEYADVLQDSLDNGEELPSVSVVNGEYSEAAVKELVSVYGDLEPIDESWNDCYGKLKRREYGDKKERSRDEEKMLLNILVYYIWRYFLKAVYDFEVRPKLMLCLASVKMTALMADEFEGDLLHRYVNAAKLYSKQMEYSTDNLEAFYDRCYGDLELRGIF